MAMSALLSGYRFGPFALDLRSGELTKNGRRIRLQEKPRSILVAFAERPGEVITRAELRERLWPNDTFVDFEDGLNTAMRKLREALDDDPQTPRFIETVRGRGYRFLADVEPVAAPSGHLGEAESAPPSLSQAIPPDAPIAPRAASRRGPRALYFLLGCAVAAAAGALWFWLAHTTPVFSYGASEPVLIADFDNQTGDPRFDRALGMALTVSLEQDRNLNVYSRLQTETALRLMKQNAAEPITATVGREICQRQSLHGLIVPGITRAGHQYRLTAQLIDPSTGIAVRSYAETAGDEDRILTALDSISTDILRDLGESRYTIRTSHRPLPQVTTASIQALEDYAQAADFFHEGRSQDAERLYKAAIAIDPSFAMAHAALGYLDYSFFLNRPGPGEQEFRTALALSGRTTEREHAWIELRYAESQGRIADALDLYRLYLQRFPGDADARYSYARLLRMNGRVQESLPIYLQLVRQEPGDGGLWIELATAYSQLHQWGPSIQAYEKAFALEPSRMLVTNVNREYGFTLIRAGDQAKAEQVFSAMLTDPDNYPQGQRSLALLDIVRGQYASARRRLMLALPGSHDPFAVARIRYMLAAVDAAQGNQRDQIAQLDRIMPVFDSLGLKVLYGALVGQAYARAGATDKARAILNRIAPIANDRVEEQVTYLGLLKAEVAVASGDPQGALQFIRPPAPDDDASPAICARETLAHVYQAMGRRDEAIAWYSQFVNSGPLGWEPQRYWADARFTLAQDYAQTGNRAAAIGAVTALLDEWKNADPGLPLLASARHLRDQLLAAHQLTQSHN